jgi:hypothetical protein
MLSAIRKRFTYANVAMTLALVFAMTGGAYAASKYLITSTKQISPKVLKSLKGANGKNGAAGPAGPAGAAGAGTAGAQGTQGAQGPQGPAGANGEKGAPGTNGGVGPTGATGAQGATGEINTAGPLPSGKTETGAWATTPFSATAGEAAIDTISFAIPLATAPEPHYLKVGETLAAHCTGNAEAPTAAPGNLCVYAGVETNRHELFIASTGNGSLVPAAGTTGALMFVQATNAGPSEFWGTWAVTG